MVQTIINLTEAEDKFINVFKAKNGFKNKNDAIKNIIREYENYLKRENTKEEFDIMLNKMKDDKDMSEEELDKLLGL